MPDDDLLRKVYCVLGMPIDVIDMSSAMRDIETAAASKTRFLISTPNLNFLVNSQSDPDFTESLLLSDLCPADGMPIVWIARFLGIPINDRVAGSDIFEALKAEHTSARPFESISVRKRRRCGRGSFQGTKCPTQRSQPRTQHPFRGCPSTRNRKMKLNTVDSAS